jgi:hypothetical protein
MKFFRSKKSPALLERRKGIRPRVELLEDRVTPSVTVGVSVEGMNTTNNSCNCQPPDTMVAAGPNHIVHMVNTAIEVFNKDGTVNSAPQSTMTFFGNHLGNHSDPNVMFDEAAGLFVAGILDFSSGSAANLFDWATGVDGPTGVTWTIQSPIASGEGSLFWDYPRIGYNADAWFFEGNMFNGNSFAHVQVITVSKAGVILSRHDDSSLFTLTPARMHGAATGGPEYFVESANAGASSLQLVTETNVLSASPTFTTQAVSVPSYRSGGSAPQGVPGFDDRIFTVAFRTVNGTGHLVAAHQVASGRRHSGPVGRIYDINPATLSQTNFDTPARVSGDATFMPSADIDTAGSIGYNYGESGSSTFWSMEVNERVGGVNQGAVQVATGVSTSPDSRVGDYSNTTVDPANGTTFWGANEYQGADFWDTHIASFSVAGAVHSPALVATLPPAGAQQAVTITVTTPSQAAAVIDRAVPSTAAGSQTASQAFSSAKVASTRAVDAFWADPASRDFLGSAL